MSETLSQVQGTSTGANVVNNFFGVYLLYSLNPKYKGRTYIGYTVNPCRRINQHNKGSKSGGARRTNNRGPWEMVLIVYGFPGDISALRFEWAWQHPQRSRRLRNVARKKPRENQFQYRIRIMLEMLRMGPWKKLPLTVQWLAEDFYQDFPVDSCPPMHMPIVVGPLCNKKVSMENELPPQDYVLESSLCSLCCESLTNEDAVSCLSPTCECVAHLTCLAKHYLGKDSADIMPVEGTCPKCNGTFLWGHIIRKKKACYNSLNK